MKTCHTKAAEQTLNYVLGSFICALYCAGVT